MRFWYFTAMALSLLAATACGDSGGDGTGGGDGPGGGVSVGETRTLVATASGIELGDDGAIRVSLGGAELGTAFSASKLKVSNVGSGPLTISSITVDSDPVGAFTLTADNGSDMPGAGPNVVLAGTSGDGTLNFYFTLVYTGDGAGQPTGSVTVRSNANIPIGSDVVTFPIQVKAGAPKLTVNPKALDFEVVTDGSKSTRQLSLLNTGDDELSISKLLLTGHVGFAFIIDSVPFTTEDAGAGLVLDPPILIAPGSSQTLPVSFEPLGPEPADATLVLFSNDPAGGQQGTAVLLQANTSGPCIILTPKKVDFGGKLVGKPATISVDIESCGDGPLEIRSMALTEESSTDFSLELSGLGLTGENSLSTDDAPIILAVNETKSFELTFVPDEINPLSAENLPIPDLGKIHLTTNAFKSELDVEIRGFGVEVECPTAIIVVAEGEEVIPQTKLHLTGSQSYASSGAINVYEWVVQQPVGSQSVFLPSATAADPTFEANVAGTYVFSLRVWDQNGEESCVPGEAVVIVNPDEAIHVELLWDTPNDPNQTDEGPEAGADLDLHFKHPFATGEDVNGDGIPDGWFDQPFDSFWFNPHPNWASLDPTVDDDPGLDRDDTDGAGPENVNLNLPQDGLEYCVGVHYWNDHGFGASEATIRVYIHSSLVFQLSEVELINHDLWEVACIQWPSGKVELVTDEGGDYKIIPNYQNALFGD